MEIFGNIAAYLWLLIAVAVPLMIVVQSIINARRLRKDHAVTVVYAISTLVFWGILTLVMILILFMSAFGSGGPEAQATAETRVAIVAISLTLLYALVGGGLFYLIRRRGKA